MRKAILILLAFIALTAKAWATDVVIASSQVPGFNPSGLSATVTISNVTANNGSAELTCSNCFQSAWVGIGGFTISVGGIQYSVASVNSRSSVTLTTTYGESSGSKTVLWYPYILLKWYADRAFQPLGATYVVQPGTPGGGAFFRQFAASVINSGSGNTLYLPQMTIPATTDALITNQARWTMGLYLPNGAAVAGGSAFVCPSSISQFPLQPNTPTSFTAICQFAGQGGIVPPANEPYTKSEIDARVPSCASNTIAYYANTGNAQACLTVGSGLSITGGALTSSGGGGTIGGSVGTNQVAFGSAPNTLSSEADFSYNATTNTLNVTGVIQQSGIAVATASNNLSFFSATTSAQLAGIISDETGSGLLVFGTSPTIVTPTIASFVNAQHAHDAGSTGGQLNASNVFSAGTVSLARGGTGTSMVDPGANRITVWDDTTNAVRFAVIGSGLSYDQPSNTLSSSGGISGSIANTQVAFGSGTAITGSNTLTYNVGSTTLNLTGTLLLGTASSVTGKVTFSVSGDANVTTVQAHDTPTGDFTIKLPGVLPSAGNECLQISSAGQISATTGATCSGGGAGPSIGGSVSGGTAGSVLFVATGPVLQQDNANFFWDDTNNRLGLGTNAPTSLLHLMTAGTTTITMDASGSASGVIQLSSTALTIAVNSTGDDLKLSSSNVAGASYTIVGSTGENLWTTPKRNTASPVVAYRFVTPTDGDTTPLSNTANQPLVRIGGDASGGAVTRTFTGVGSALQTETLFVAPTYSGGGNYTVTATVGIADAPNQGGERLALYVASGKTRLGGALELDSTLQVDSDATISGTTSAIGLLTTDNGASIDVLGTTSAITLASNPGAYLDAPGEVNDWFVNLARTVNFSSGTTLANQRSIFINAPTFNGDVAKTLTRAATVAITGAPIASTNITITTALALSIESGNIQLGTPSTSASNIRFANASNANTLTLSAGATSTSYTLTFPLAAPGSTQCLQMSSAGAITTTGSSCGGGGGSPGGADTQVQYNAAGVFGGISGLTSDGTNATAGSGNFRATRPRFTTSIDDSNANEVIGITATGSAVNEITVANAATGNGPTISTTGGDTNIPLVFDTKGTGAVIVEGPASDATASLNVRRSDATGRNVIIYPSVTKNATNDPHINLNSGQTYGAGIFLEQTGQILSYAINATQNVGSRDTAVVGGIFRLDARSTQQVFSVIGIPTGGSTEATRLLVSLQNSDIYLGDVTATSPITSLIHGTSGSGTNVAGANIRLAPGQPTGNAAPGVLTQFYSLSSDGSGTTLRNLSTNQYAIPAVMGTLTVAGSFNGTASETSFFNGGTIIGTRTIEANLSRVGRTYHVAMRGVMTTTVTVPTLRIRVKIGSTTIMDSGAQTINSGNAISNGTWNLDFDLTISALGASGTAQVGGTFFRYNNGTANNFQTLILSTSGAATIDTTAANAIDVTGQFSNTNGEIILDSCRILIEN